MSKVLSSFVRLVCPSFLKPVLYKFHPRFNIYILKHYGTLELWQMLFNIIINNIWCHACFDTSFKNMTEPVSFVSAVEISFLKRDKEHVRLDLATFSRIITHMSHRGVVLLFLLKHNDHVHVMSIRRHYYQEIFLSTFSQQVCFGMKMRCLQVSQKLTASL